MKGDKRLKLFSLQRGWLVGQRKDTVGFQNFNGNK